MPDNIANIGGNDAFVSARQVPWHRLGTVTEGALTAKEAADAAFLSGWNVRKEDLITVQGAALVKGRYATVRDNPAHGGVEYLGIVGERYQIVQNEEAFEVLDLIADQSGAHYETAGALGNGERVFMSMKLPEAFTVAGQDAHDVYLLATNSHDGSSSFTVAVTPVRVVCQNTLTMALKSARQSWSIRHTQSVQGRIMEARESLQLTYKYLDTFGEELNRMLEQEFTNSQFQTLTQSLMPVSPEAVLKDNGWTERRKGEQKILRSLFSSADTNEFGRGTKYAAYNAITEYADWMMPLKGQSNQAVRRAQRAMTGTTVQAFKDRGLSLLRAA